MKHEPRVRIEWRDDERPWAEHEAEWQGSRVPVQGDYICVLNGSDCKKVKEVLWDIDGRCTVRLEQHPR